MSELFQIPITALPFQEFSAVLGGQNCVIVLRQMGDDLYCDLTADDQVILQGRSCQSGSLINLYPTPNFSGKLFFIDTQGHENPRYEGLGSRWQLLYLS